MPCRSVNFNNTSFILIEVFDFPSIIDAIAIGGEGIGRFRHGQGYDEEGILAGAGASSFYGEVVVDIILWFDDGGLQDGGIAEVDGWCPGIGDDSSCCSGLCFFLSIIKDEEVWPCRDYRVSKYFDLFFDGIGITTQVCLCKEGDGIDGGSAVAVCRVL